MYHNTMRWSTSLALKLSVQGLVPQASKPRNCLGEILTISSGHPSIAQSYLAPVPIILLPTHTQPTGKVPVTRQHVRGGAVTSVSEQGRSVSQFGGDGRLRLPSFASYGTHTWHQLTGTTSPRWVSRQDNTRTVRTS
jgi:hypothetical protein